MELWETRAQGICLLDYQASNLKFIVLLDLKRERIFFMIEKGLDYLELFGGEDAVKTGMVDALKSKRKELSLSNREMDRICKFGDHQVKKWSTYNFSAKKRVPKKAPEFPSWSLIQLEPFQPKKWKDQWWWEHEMTPFLPFCLGVALLLSTDWISLHRHLSMVLFQHLLTTFFMPF